MNHLHTSSLSDQMHFRIMVEATWLLHKGTKSRLLGFFPPVVKCGNFSGNSSIGFCSASFYCFTEFTAVTILPSSIPHKATGDYKISIISPMSFDFFFF